TRVGCCRARSDISKGNSSLVSVIRSVVMEIDRPDRPESGSVGGSRRPAVEQEGLGLEELERAFQAALTPDTGLLVAAEANAEVDSELVVPNRARPQLAGDPARAFDVGGEDRVVETEGR